MKTLILRSGGLQQWQSPGPGGVILLHLGDAAARISNYMSPVPSIRLWHEDHLYYRLDAPQPDEVVLVITTSLNDPVCNFAGQYIEGALLSGILFPPASLELRQVPSVGPEGQIKLASTEYLGIATLGITEVRVWDFSELLRVG